MPVKTGDTVKVWYEGKLDDGTIFDSSERQGTPLQFKVGAGEVIPGFEKAVLGMNVGEEKMVRLLPQEAYGDADPRLRKVIPRPQLPQQPEPQVGMSLLLKLPEGVELPARIIEVTPQTVTINLNPPLAGKALQFRIRVLQISSS